MAHGNHFEMRGLKRLPLAVCALLGASLCCLGQAPEKTVKPSPVVAPAAPAAPAVAPSLFDRPAQPAKVTLSTGTLTVQADNSSLTDILSQISHAGGMTVDGLQTVSGSNQRVFGTYGPGAPREVLADLLHGMDYNVVMLGETPAGTPRQLTLSSRTGGGAVSAPQRPQQPVIDPDADSDDTRQPYTEDNQPPAPENPQPPQASPRGVRTPQQMLQELQQMHQQQLEQQQNPQN